MSDRALGHLSGLDDFLDLAPDFIFFLDEEGRFLSASRASLHIHGYSENELLGRTFLDFVHQDDRAVVEGLLSLASSANERPIAIRYRFRDRDGTEGRTGEASYRWVEARCRTRAAGDGARLTLLISRDVSAEMDKESLALETLREKEAVLREIQHRIKNSIAMISSFISLEEGRVEAGELRDALESLRFRVDSISTLYRMQFASGDSAMVSLGSYLEKIVSDIGQTIDRSEVTMRLEIADISLDTKRAVPLGILCTELVANALRHGFGAEDEGFVAVKLSLEGGRLVLVVEDDGRGLPEDFTLASQEGLGLQIAKMLSLQLKGKLAFGGRGDGNKGGGARFVLDMPLSPRE